MLCAGAMEGGKKVPFLLQPAAHQPLRLHVCHTDRREGRTH